MKRNSAKPRARPRRAIAFAGTDITLRPYKELGFKPETLVVGISSEGLVGPLVASHLIERLDLHQVCAFDSPSFPPATLVHFQEPNFPARIYASKAHRLAVVLAEFAPPDDLARPLAQVLLAWCEANGVQRVIGIEGFDPEVSRPVGIGVAAVGSTAQNRKAIRDAGIKTVEHGAMTGVAAVLLNEGCWQARSTIVLMAASTPATDEEDVVAHCLPALRKLMPRLPATALKTPKPTRLELAIRSARDLTSFQEFI